MFEPTFNLSTLNSSNGFAINGIAAYDRSGWSVSSAGDVNGDGFDDLIIGATGADPNGIPFAGKSYIVFGSNNGFGASFNLSELNGSNGFTINGIAANNNSGSSVSSAGDVNGDGIDDLIIGAVLADPNGLIYAGQSYVVFGSNSSFGADLNLSELNGSNGFAINGIAARDYLGFSVSSAGDVNGDGIDDLIIGAYNADPNGITNAGQSYVVFGSNSGFGASFNLSALNGSNGFAINGIAASDFSGWSVSSAGDVNGDGFDDLIIGAYNADPNGITNAGQSYVVFGSNSGFGVSFNLSDLNGSNGFAINGIAANDFSGSSVSSAGDVNGDGIDDLIIGARRAGPNGISDAGQSYVVFGSNSGFAAGLNLSTLDGSNGFAINGIAAYAQSGSSVSSAGDVNGDGIDDLIIGARFADPNGIPFAGQSYVVFGSNSGFAAGLNLSTLDGSNGFAINGIAADDFSGGSVSSAGDVNGDGFDDLIIGAYNADPNGIREAGQSYVVFGQGTTPTNQPPVANSDSATTAQNTAVTLEASTLLANDTDANGDRLSLTGVSNAVNGSVTFSNGNVIFTPSTNFTGNASFDYSISDGKGGTASGLVNVTVEPVLGTVQNGTKGNDTLTGTEGNDFLNGRNGNDSLIGNAGNDILIGGNGKDFLVGSAGDDLLNGDNGSDTLTGGLGNDTLTGGNGADVFVFAFGEGIDTITDFKLDTDQIGLTEGLTFGNLSFSGNEILIGSEVLAVLTGVNTNTLTASNFVTV
jgi:Ca2+-binding RTX toxin-like protein